MKTKPIGVFDSGLGGLTVVRELNKVLPNENIVYFGDTGRVPYGTRSTQTIKKYAQQDINFLHSMDVKMIIAACGTVSSVATDVLKNVNLPCTGVVKPTAKTASQVTKNGRIGVIGTSATVLSGAFERELKKIDPSIRVFSQACPLFVQLVENGWIEPNDEITLLVVKRYLAELVKNNVDTLVLGCTHFPILSNFIEKVMGDKVNLIDTGKETAHYAFELLKREELLNDNEDTTKKTSFFVSDSSNDFSKLAGIFLGRDVDSDVFHIEIESLK